VYRQLCLCLQSGLPVGAVAALFSSSCPRRPFFPYSFLSPSPISSPTSSRRSVINPSTYTASSRMRADLGFGHGPEPLSQRYGISYHESSVLHVVCLSVRCFSPIISYSPSPARAVCAYSDRLSITTPPHHFSSSLVHPPMCVDSLRQTRLGHRIPRRRRRLLRLWGPL